MSTFLTAYFTTFIIEIVIIVGIIIWFKSSKKKPTVSEKTEATKSNETKKAVVLPPKEKTIFTDWRMWLTIVLGYILFGIIQTQQYFTVGISHEGIPKLPDGMLYLPISGMFYAVLFAFFVYLTLHLSLKNPLIGVFGVVFGIVCLVASMFGFWFIPYIYPHVESIPFLFVGSFPIPFPSDPIVPALHVGIGIILLYLVIKFIGNKQWTDPMSGVSENFLLIIAATLFLPQLFCL